MEFYGSNCSYKISLCTAFSSPAIADQPPKEDLFFQAVKENSIKEIETLIKTVNVNAKDGNGLTALMIISAYQTSNIVELLLKNGANPNDKSIAGETALSLTQQNPHEEVVKVLKSYGAK